MLVSNPVKICNMYVFWEKNLSMLKLVIESKSHGNVVSQLLPVNNLKAWHSRETITNLVCCTRREIEVRHLMNK